MQAFTKTALLFVNIFFVILTVRAEGIRLLATHPSNPDAFTQGLEISSAGTLYLSTGLYGKSHIGVLHLADGSYEIRSSLDEKFFGEGITFSPAGLWQLTWKNQTAFLRDANTLDVIQTFHNEYEGWGIAYDKKQDQLLVSDGSNRIFIRSAKDFRLLNSFTVERDMLNELEYADGFLYANIWLTNEIVKIDLSAQKIVQTYDFSRLIDDLEMGAEERANMDVLNGIAHIESKRFYVTGKQYPVVLEVELE